VIGDATDKKMQDIQAKVVSTLANDYNAWKLAQTAGSATSQPSSSVGSPYTSDQYLRDLALSIQKDFGVLPTIGLMNHAGGASSLLNDLHVGDSHMGADSNAPGDWYSAADLASVPGIGKASLTGERADFATYAMQAAVPFLPVEDQNLPQAMALWQPSKTLEDEEQNQFVFRLTDADPAHSSTLKDSEDQVRQDIRTADAYDMAQTAAAEFAAKATSPAVMKIAADAMHLDTITTGLFSPGRSATAIPGYVCKPESVRILTGAVKQLLLIDPKTGQHPGNTIASLGPDRKWLVVTLNDVRADWNADDVETARAQAGAELGREWQQALEMRWCDLSNLVTRVGFQPDASAAPNPAG
jgi:hypothetical protein